MRSASLFAVTVLAVILAASLFSPVAAISGITIAKVTTNGDVTTKFDFTFTPSVDTGSATPGSNGGSVSFSIPGGGSVLEGPLAAGTYTVVETVPAGWFVKDISCEGIVSVPEPSSFTFIPGEGVIITYAEGDHVTCTFTNSPVAPAVGGLVMPANVFAVLGPWLAVIGLVGCIGAVVVGSNRWKKPKN